MRIICQACRLPLHGGSITRCLTECVRVRGTKISNARMQGQLDLAAPRSSVEAPGPLRRIGTPALGSGQEPLDLIEDQIQRLRSIGGRSGRQWSFQVEQSESMHRRPPQVLGMRPLFE